MKSAKREVLIETARDLFYRQGFHATGIDTILAESGVAKMTLYKHFKSKDDLILAVLCEYDERWREWVRSEIARRAKTPRQRLMAIFRILQDRATSDEFRGCLLINAAAEFAGLDPKIQALVLELRQRRRQAIEQLAVAAKVRDPQKLAAQLSLLLEGMIVMALIHRNPADAETACLTAESLIRQAIAKPKRRSRTGSSPQPT